MSDTTELMTIEDAVERFRKLSPCSKKYPYPRKKGIVHELNTAWFALEQNNCIL